jgi:two-component system sensor kinase FixL
MKRQEEQRVLVVEDDADARDNMRDILELDGYLIETATSVADVKRRGDWSGMSCVILDRKLPDGDGADLLPYIQHRAPDVPVVMVTGFADLDGAVSALRNGAADYILKPINPDALRASLTRLTERKRSEMRLRALFENALDGIVIIDDDGRYIEANPAACAIFGYSAEELLKLSVRDVIELAAGQTFDSFWRDFLAAGRESGESPMVRKDGSIIAVEFRAVANFLPGLHLSSIRDVTERRRAEERARQAERLAAVGETMTGLIHEGRNALQRSKACLEMLALEVEDRPSALDLVARAERAQNELHRLYEEVRQYAAPVNLRREKCDLGEIWRETWSHLAQLHREKEMRLREEVSGDLNCEVDRFAIGQVLRNVLENAIQASPEKAQVVIKCIEDSLDGQPALSCRVCDCGPGMKAEQRRRIFEPFFTTKTKGTGLGMAISQRIVQSHNGWISVADRDGPGAEIILTLPRGRV